MEILKAIDPFKCERLELGTFASVSILMISVIVMSYIYNVYSELTRMRDLDPEHIDQLITLRGMVVRCSSIIPEIKQAFFRCFSCSFTMDVVIDRNKIDEPRKCPTCNVSPSL